MSALADLCGFQSAHRDVPSRCKDQRSAPRIRGDISSRRFSRIAMRELCRALAPVLRGARGGRHCPYRWLRREKTNGRRRKLSRPSHFDERHRSPTALTFALQISNRESLGQENGVRVGRLNRKIAPHGTFGIVHMRPPCASIIERQIDSPIPMPPDLVV
jgi:hypothetical protein